MAADMKSPSRYACPSGAASVVARPFAAVAALGLQLLDYFGGKTPGKKAAEDPLTLSFSPRGEGTPE